jgi:hypothetical protein
MKSDVWYYNVNSRLKDMVVSFEDERVKGMVSQATEVKKKVDALKEKEKK